uniref:Rhodopsin domain-containing protein n=2 Tax=Bionectria ochroleuca TaxID=29856 RepID=A0A8H7N2Y7_BIOOC
MTTITITKETLMALPPEYMAHDTSHRLQHTGIALMVIVNCFYILFNASRIFFAERNGWEIWTVYPMSYCCCLSLAILCHFFATDGGAGRHAAYWLLHNPATITKFLKYQTASQFIYMVGITLPKVALLILYLKVFADRKVIIATWVVMCLLIGLCFSSVVALFAICQPFAYNWNKSIPGGHCGNFMAAYKYISIPNIVSDVAILLLPIPSLWSLNMSRWKKAGVFATFAVGGLGIITSIIRFVGFYRTNVGTDVTNNGGTTVIYTALEVAAYFICSCLPGTRPLARAIYQGAGLGTYINSHFGSWDKSKGSSSHATSGNSRSNGIALNNMKGRHKTSVSTSMMSGPNQNQEEYDGRAFIRLEESVHVDFSSVRSSNRGSSEGIMR